jgi:hypothetical protein
MGFNSAFKKLIEMKRVLLIKRCRHFWLYIDWMINRSRVNGGGESRKISEEVCDLIFFCPVWYCLI